MSYRVTHLILFLFFAASLFGQEEEFEAYYLLNGVYPDDEDAFWFPNNVEIQGVTNDGENWFFTVTGHTDANGTDEWGKIWKIPRDVPLGANSSDHSGVISWHLKDLPALKNNWHWGDPDHYNYQGVDYILVPAYGENEDGIIICFQADNLQYVSYGDIDGHPGWCAIDPEGNLYTSKSPAKALVKRKINWEMLTNSSNHDVFYDAENISLNFPSGATYTDLKHMQGGEFSDSGSLLYIVSGSAGCFGLGPGKPEASDGIHVFSTSNWREIQTSRKNGSDHFLYNFDNNCEGLFGSESPEGLTVWNLGEDAPDNVEGQLHVLLFHWNLGSIGGSNNHKLSLHHFSNKIYVDPTSAMGNRRGTRFQPFRTFNEAFFTYPVWDGAEIILNKGTYQDIGVYNQQVLITSRGGPAVIGK